MKYLSWDHKTITDFSPEMVADMYDKGYVFTRIGKGVMDQTRSCRIDLSKFELSSENRRILKKTDGLMIRPETLPYSGYDFKIGKQGKDFYDAKFGRGVMSAQKIKEMMTDETKSNFNLCLFFNVLFKDGGCAICYEGDKILHYSFPFYDLNQTKDTGLGMMLRAIQYAKEKGLKYIYLGSLQRPGDTYKLQFAGLEWFDGKKWRTDTEPLKEILK